MKKGSAGWRRPRYRRGVALLVVAVFGALPGVVAVRPAAAGHGGIVVAPIEWARRLVEAGQPPIFVDLRPADEYRRGRLPGAHSLPLPELSRRYVELPQQQRIVLYCTCPRQELEAAFVFLVSKGYANASVMLEGFADWTSKGYPVER